jgi:endonuclease IV
VIDEEYRVSYVTDRTNTFGKALLGVTLECAHCHDHKYDPFSQKEYYQVFAFFNNVKEAGLAINRGRARNLRQTPHDAD